MGNNNVNKDNNRYNYNENKNKTNTKKLYYQHKTRKIIKDKEIAGTTMNHTKSNVHLACVQEQEKNQWKNQ